MRILLVYPPAMEVYGRFKPAAILAAQPQMPLGVLYVGAVLEQEGHQVAILDGDVDQADMDNMIDGRCIEIGYGLPSDIIFDPKDSSIIIQTSDTTIHIFKVDIGSERMTLHTWREVIE